MAPRSTAGCYTCKRRKKKCDETQPHCQRCLRSGKECEGYAPLESPDGRGIMRRSKVAPVGSALSRPQPDTPYSMEPLSKSKSPPSTNTSDQSGSDPVTPPHDNPGPSVSLWSSTDSPDSFLPQEVIWNPNATTPTPLPNSLPGPSYRSLKPSMTSGATLSDSPNYLGNRDSQDVILQTQGWPGFSRHPRLMAVGMPHGSISEIGEEDDPERDIEGAKQEMNIVPMLDPNTPQNTLPFILQCYARWINLVVFEPNKGTLPMKDAITNKFMRSPEERPRIILLANAIGSLGKSIRPSQKAASLISYLRTEAYQTIAGFISDEPVGDREVDRQKALDTLDLMMEVVLIQRYSNSMLTIVNLMQATAPIFRRACPEPFDQYVNLPRAVFSPSINVRHFATTDIIMTITTGRPLLFRYDVTCPPDILMLINDGRFGMQWLHGVPDQYIIILARITVLAEELEPGAIVSAECVAEIEHEIREVEPSTERSINPVSTIWKYTVRECWRLTMYIYLYMVLCRTSTDDPRVLKSVKTFVRLLQAVKPGRNPDSFLYIPMIIIGAAAYRKQDRAVIGQRMYGLQECMNPGSCGHDVLNILIDLWTRTEGEDGGAYWSDFRMSSYRVTGI